MSFEAYNMEGKNRALGEANQRIAELEDFVKRLGESKNYFAWWRYVDEARVLAGLPPRSQADGEVKP